MFEYSAWYFVKLLCKYVNIPIIPTTAATAFEPCLRAGGSKSGTYRNSGGGGGGGGYVIFCRQLGRRK